MNDLVTWLRNELLTDEQHATKDLHVLDAATAGGNWTAHYGHNLPNSFLKAGDVEVARTVTANHDPDAMAIARFVKLGRAKAARVLAEVEAKRRLIDQWREAEREAPSTTTSPYTTAPEALFIGRRLAIEAVLRRVAAVYADRPGYDEEWRP